MFVAPKQYGGNALCIVPVLAFLLILGGDNK
jgi:hypothetical protein